MRSAGLREYSKSQLVKVVEHATLKQIAAEQAHARTRHRYWTALGLAVGLGFAVGLGVGVLISAWGGW